MPPRHLRVFRRSVDPNGQFSRLPLLPFPGARVPALWISLRPKSDVMDWRAPHPSPYRALRSRSTAAPRGSDPPRGRVVGVFTAVVRSLRAPFEVSSRPWSSRRIAARSRTNSSTSSDWLAVVSARVTAAIGARRSTAVDACTNWHEDAPMGIDSRPFVHPLWGDANGRLFLVWLGECRVGFNSPWGRCKRNSFLQLGG
jgi:hypothetical protein